MGSIVQEASLVFSAALFTLPYIHRPSSAVALTLGRLVPNLIPWLLKHGRRNSATDAGATSGVIGHALGGAGAKYGHGLLDRISMTVDAAALSHPKPNQGGK